MLVIDDFGRQRSSPAEILNRWIVPHESRVDHLVLQSGQKFEMPFETLIVFARAQEIDEVLHLGYASRRKLPYLPDQVRK